MADWQPKSPEASQPIETDEVPMVISIIHPERIQLIEQSQNHAVKVCHDGELHPIICHATFAADIFDI